MSLETLALSSITQNTLINFIDAKISESVSIDYKLELPGGSDGARRDFLADIASFANAQGGHILFGVPETDGVPTGLVGIEGDPDKAVLRLDGMARDGVRPPVPGLEFAAVAVDAQKFCVVARIPKSWSAPHQVIFQKDFRFYTRGSAGKQHMDLTELRTIFLRDYQTGERIRRFREERLSAISRGDSPVRLNRGPLQILHIVPVSAFALGASINLAPLSRDRGKLVAVMDRGGSLRHNVDGLLAFSPNNAENDAYVQIYRNGILEIVTRLDEWSPRGTPVLPSVSFEEGIFDQISRVFDIMQMTGASSPLVLMLSFFGIKGWEMGVDDWRPLRTVGGFDRDPLLIPELVVNDTDSVNVKSVLKPMIDNTWNAAGFAESAYYDSSGEWVGPKRR